MADFTLLANFFTDPLWKDGWLYGWQILPLLAIIGLLIFLKIYKNKQM